MHEPHRILTPWRREGSEGTGRLQHYFFYQEVEVAKAHLPSKARARPQSMGLRSAAHEAGNSDLALAIFHRRGPSTSHQSASERHRRAGSHHEDEVVDDGDEDEDMVLVSVHPDDGTVHHENVQRRAQPVDSVTAITANALVMLLTGPESLDDELDAPAYGVRPDSGHCQACVCTDRITVGVGCTPCRDPLRRTGAHIEPSAEDEMRLRAAQYTMFTWVQIPHLDLCISYSVRAR